MKKIKFLIFATILAFAAGCTDEIISPNTDGDGEDDPIVVGDPLDPGSTTTSSDSTTVNLGG